MKKSIFRNIVFLSAFLFIALLIKKQNDIIVEERKNRQKYNAYYELLVEWMKLKQRGLSVVEYLVRNNINNVAIYGNGALGKMLYKELENNKCIDVKYFIDKNSRNQGDVMTILPAQMSDYEEIDMVIVTPFMEYFEIKNDLKISDDKIFSLEDIIYYCKKD